MKFTKRAIIVHTKNCNTTNESNKTTWVAYLHTQHENSKTNLESSVNNSDNGILELRQKKSLPM